ITMVTSQASTSSAGEPADFAPASTSGLVFAAFRFQTLTSCPTDISRCAIADPIRPVPHTPIFMFGLVLTLLLPGLIRVIDTEILRDQFFIFQQLACAAGNHAAPGVEDDRLIGNVERQLEILLDQNDRLSFRLQKPDGAADFSHDQRCKSLRWLVEQ